MQAPIECTLLDLVRGVNQVTEDEQQVVMIVVYLVNSGRVRLCGTFAGAKIKLPASLSAFPEQRSEGAIGGEWESGRRGEGETDAMTQSTQSTQSTQ